MSRSAALQLTLWPLLVGYAAWLIPYAWHELAEDAPIQGLHRTYAPPSPLPGGGQIIDPRPLDLLTELQRRYRPGAPLPPPPRDPADPTSWQPPLAALGLRARPGRARAPLTGPRLTFDGGQPRLILGRFDHDYVAADPAHGICLLPELARADGPALDLDLPLEQRWHPATPR